MVCNKQTKSEWGEKETKRRRRDDEDDLDTVFGTPPTYVEEDLDNFGRPMLPTLAKEMRTTAR